MTVLQQNAPELLMPAGSLQKVEYALAYGADAVYVGVPLFSLRARENDFGFEELLKARELTRKYGKKLYVTANIFARNRKINAFDRQLGKMLEAQPDALIMSDPGLIQMVRAQDKNVPIHLSVQANVMNWQGVKFWHETVGVERAILSRELNVNEIAEIHAKVPTVELEAFVHGAICIAYSGRCLMSSYFTHRDANQGVCDNSCREKFNVYAADVEKNKDYYLEDLRNKGEFYQINEDENGTYLMNAKDLCVIEYLKELKDAGVCSFKVEGRTKSENYVAIVAKSYRRAIDDMMAGRPFDKTIWDDLNKVSNRGYSTGFMIQNPGTTAQNYDSSNPRSYTQRVAGLVQTLDTTPDGFVSIQVRNKIKIGDRCQFIEPRGEGQYFTVTRIVNTKGNDVEVAHGGTGVFHFAVDYKPQPYSLLSLVESRGAIEHEVRV